MADDAPRITGRPPDDWTSLYHEYTASEFKGDREQEVRYYYVQIDANPIMQRIFGGGSEEWDVDAHARDYVDFLRTELQPIVQGSGVTLAIEPYGGPKTGGPVPDQQYVIGLVDLYHAAEAIVVLAEGAKLLRGLISKLEEITRKDILISDGDAEILAAEAILTATNETDLTLDYVRPMDRRDEDREIDILEGWLVGFSSDEGVYTAHVDRVGGLVTLMKDESSLT